MKIQVINIDGKKTATVDVSDNIFVPKPNKNLIQTIIDWQINNLKPRKAKTKQRNEVTGSTRKIYAQKGTGGARHSSRKAPIFVGGGVAHGPKGAVYKIKKINKKIKKLGLLHILSQKSKIKSLFVIEDFKSEIKKTKIFNNFLKKCNLKKMRCPYHGRSFDLDGTMDKVPGFDGAKNFPSKNDKLLKMVD